MPNAEHDRDNSLSRIGGGVRRHKGLVIGASGLAALIGAGVVVAAERAHPATSDNAASSLEAPMAAEQAAVPPVKTTTGPAKPSTGRLGPFASPAPSSVSPAPSSVEQRVNDARGANERLGTTVRQPKTPANGGYVADPSKIKTVETGNVSKDRWTLRVVSAPEDLSGQRELAWVADGGQKYGDAECTQTIQMSNNAEPKTLPTLLICWRTSATRSAYTVAVNLNHKPSKKASVAALDKAWAALS